MEHSQLGKAADSIFEVMAGALIGVDIISVIQLVSLPTLDKRLTVALYCFVISLPMLGFFVFSLLIEKTRNCSLNSWYKAIASVIGMMTTLSGIGFLISHLSQTAAMIFVILSVVAFVFVNYHITVADRHKRSVDSRGQ